MPGQGEAQALLWLQGWAGISTGLVAVVPRAPSGRGDIRERRLCLLAVRAEALLVIMIGLSLLALLDHRLGWRRALHCDQSEKRLERDDQDEDG
jgi:hypothetical protein